MRHGGCVRALIGVCDNCKYLCLHGACLGGTPWARTLTRIRFVARGEHVWFICSRLGGVMCICGWARGCQTYVHTCVCLLWADIGL